MLQRNPAYPEDDLLTGVQECSVWVRRQLQGVRVGRAVVEMEDGFRSLPAPGTARARAALVAEG